MAEKIALKLLNIEGDGYHLQARVKINGKSALVIVDTGASRTVFDRTEIGQYLKKESIAENDRLSTGLGTNSMQSQFVVLGSFSLGKVKIENYNAVVLDLGHVNQTYTAIGLKSVAGVLGSDVLVSMNAVIDFKKKSLTLFPAAQKSKKRIVKKAAKKKASTKKVPAKKRRK